MKSTPKPAARRGLATHIYRTFSVFVALAMLLMTIATVYLSGNAIQKKLAESMHDRTKFEIVLLGKRLEYLIESTEALVNNPSIVGGISDPDGSAARLSKTVINFSEMRHVHSLAMVGFDTHPIYSTLDDPPLFDQLPLLRNTLAQGVTNADIDAGNKRLVVYTPIEYYSTTLGAMVVEFDLEAIARGILPNHPQYSQRLLSEEQELYSRNFDPKQNYIKARASLDDESLSPLIQTLELSLESGAKRTAYLSPLYSIAIDIALLGALIMIAALILAIFVGNSIARPMLLLRQRVGEADGTPERRCAPLGTGDELEDLAQIFDKRTAELLETQQSLEKRVQERTQSLALTQTDLKETYRQLEENTAHLEHAQELAHLGNWVLDIASGSFFWSAEVYRIFGLEPNIHPATYQFFLGAIVDEDQVLVEEAIDAAVDSKDPNYHYKVEHRIQRPNGEIRHVQETGSVVYDEKGKPIQMIGAVLDITAVKESEIELRVAKENAQDADTAKSQFLASMSHELRTPMNAILGFAQLLELDDSLDKNNLDSVREILKGGDHLLSLINEVLELSRIEAGTTDLLLETVVLSPVINECLDLMRPLAEQRDIRINYSGLDGVAVRADRTRIKQVLLNLLSNAVKYNNEGGSVKIGVQKEEGDQVRLWVQDTGPGIQEELLPYVFAPFNRLGAENSEIEGTGIGLTITQKIVTLMGGSLGVDSHVGQGSVFWIELPNESLPEALHESQYESKYVPSKSDVPDNHIEAQKQTVLYIEDNPANLRLVANIISRRKLKPIHLLTADTPEEGIELALSHRPKLILLDINMPGMDGYQVLEILRADATFESIPIVAVSASAMTRDIERGKAAGFDDYLTKPLNIHHFYEVIDQLLG